MNGESVTARGGCGAGQKQRQRERSASSHLAYSARPSCSGPRCARGSTSTRRASRSFLARFFGDSDDGSASAALRRPRARPPAAAAAAPAHVAAPFAKTRARVPGPFTAGKKKHKSSRSGARGLHIHGVGHAQPSAVAQRAGGPRAAPPTSSVNASGEIFTACASKPSVLPTPPETSSTGLLRARTGGRGGEARRAAEDVVQPGCGAATQQSAKRPIRAMPRGPDHAQGRAPRASCCKPARTPSLTGKTRSRIR